jgi:hypothetical protein
MARLWLSIMGRLTIACAAAALVALAQGDGLLLRYVAAGWLGMAVAVFMTLVVVADGR